jgi:uncharacterized protein YbjQ (UPF0145 family)
MIVTTTESVPGREIAKILGVVHDAQTAWVSGKRAQEKIIRSLTRQAEALGADAIIGLKLQLISVGGYSGVGTAVKLKEPPKDSARPQHSR